MVDLLAKRTIEAPKVSPALKREMNKGKVPRFMATASGQEIEQLLPADGSGPGIEIQPDSRDPHAVLKRMDTTMESFFYNRSYTERNFTFYLQVLGL